MGDTGGVRQRVVLALTWLLATTVATLVGLLATNMVGDVVRGAGPLGPVFSAEPTEPAEPAETVRRTVTHQAAQLVASCTGRVATLVSVTPTPGWTIGELEMGPDEDVDVELRHGTTRIDIEVYCNRGIPQPVIS